MMIKNLKEDKYLMCAWCGETFRKDDDFFSKFSEHQIKNKSCTEYFEIEIIRKIIPAKA